MVAAEAREFAGLLRRVSTNPWPLPNVAFSRRSGSTLLVANGAGPRSVQRILHNLVQDFDEVISTGFCGALDPNLRVGDIVEAQPTEIWSEDRIVVSAEEKQQLRERTGARIVDMEYAAVAAKAREWNIPCRAVRVVSDSAQEDLPLDFNRYRDAEGRFQLTRIAVAGLVRPFSVLPKLLQLDRNSRLAAEKLGAFLADSEF